MGKLFLVKHALPDIQPGVAAQHWLLGNRVGRRVLV